MVYKTLNIKFENLDLRCVCGGYTYKLLSNFSRFKVIKCRNCGLVRNYPIPKFNYRNRFRSAPLRRQPAIERVKIENAKTILKLISKYCRKGRLIDVGCGRGVLVKEALKTGYDAYGLEINKRYVKYGKELLGLNDRIIEGDIFNINFKRKFNIVVSRGLIEHLLDPINFLDKIYDCLEKLGLIIIGCPNFNSLMRLVFKENWRDYVPNQHIWHFTSKTLKAIMEKSGFEIIEIVIKSYVLPEWFTRGVKVRIYYLLNELFGFLGYGDDMIMIGYKKR